MESQRASSAGVVHSRLAQISRMSARRLSRRGRGLSPLTQGTRISGRPAKRSGSGAFRIRDSVSGGSRAGSGFPGGWTSVPGGAGSGSSSRGSTAFFRRCGERGRCVLGFAASACDLPGLSDSGVTGGSSRPSPVGPSPRRTRVRSPTLEKAAAIPVPPSVSRPPNPSTVRPSFRTSAVAPLTFPSGPRRARVLRTMPPPTLRAACPTRTATRAAFSPSTAIR